MITINIGTDRGNITGVELDRYFEDLKFSEIKAIAAEQFGEEVAIQGWADVTPKRVNVDRDQFIKRKPALEHFFGSTHGKAISKNYIEQNLQIPRGKLSKCVSKFGDRYLDRIDLIMLNQFLKSLQKEIQTLINELPTL